VYYRLLRPGDFGAFTPLLHPPFKISPQVKAALPSLLRRLFQTEQITGGVVVDPKSTGADSIVGFGLTTFLGEAFVAEFLAAPQPYVSGIVFERLLSGGSPVLRRHEIGRANESGNLNLLVLHFGMRANPADGRGLAIIAAAEAGFRLSHAGYRVRRLMQEAYGPQHVAFIKAAGLLLKSDYAGYYASAGCSQPPPHERPYLMGLDREDADSTLPGTTASFLFQAATPRFSFSPAEQRVLVRAVGDESDEEIADLLGLSRDAVKKIWRRVSNASRQLILICSAIWRIIGSSRVAKRSAADCSGTCDTTWRNCGHALGEIEAVARFLTLSNPP
jgi:DNA-binding CsgD family transcriptional regulator